MRLLNYEVKFGIMVATACLMIEPCLPAEVMSPMLTSRCEVVIMHGAWNIHRYNLSLGLSFLNSYLHPTASTLPPWEQPWEIILWWDYPW